MNTKFIRNTFVIVCIAAVICIPTIYYIRYYLGNQSISTSGIVMAVCFTLVATACISSVNIAICYFFRSKTINHKGYLRIFFLELLITSINAIIIIIGVVFLFHFIFGESKN